MLCPCDDNNYNKLKREKVEIFVHSQEMLTNHK